MSEAGDEDARAAIERIYRAESRRVLATLIRLLGDFDRAEEALQPTRTATTVRVRGGKTQSTDGPFAETREQLGGYYIVEAKDLDEATKIAARIPSARLGSIEIRPVMKFG